ncbi:hypothetical protein KFE25_006143 [Diacronema lutheri]|uniref:Cyclin N-terminal domain-containing protein n=1 Tax=Diacronema lutheri TaxID=2081491 RepID=A0A8J6CJ98_DIALT|nr:hypothetical protein KFE25_006143 [Diacronema lutheri]
MEHGVRDAVGAERADVEPAITLGRLHPDMLINGVAYALYAHVVAFHQAPHAGAGNAFAPLVNEAGWLLVDDDPFWAKLGKGVPPPLIVKKLKEFIVVVYNNMRLEPELLIMSLVLIERLINAVGNGLVRATTVRPLFAVAVGIACKCWFDEATFVGDFCDTVCGDRINLHRLIVAEASFCEAIRFKVIVPAKVFIKYYFALMDMIHAVNQHSEPAARRRRYSAPRSLTHMQRIVAGMVVLPSRESLEELPAHEGGLGGGKRHSAAGKYGLKSSATIEIVPRKAAGGAIRQT